MAYTSFRSPDMIAPLDVEPSTTSERGDAATAPAMYGNMGMKAKAAAQIFDMLLQHGSVSHRCVPPMRPAFIEECDGAVSSFFSWVVPRFDARLSLKRIENTWSNSPHCVVRGPKRDSGSEGSHRMYGCVSR